MTVEEIKKEAEAQGYTLAKKKYWDCACHMGYPNELRVDKNGRCKCEDYICLNPDERPVSRLVRTKCVRKQRAI